MANGNPPQNRLNLEGQKHNHLTAISPTNRRTSGGATYWLFRCDCGKEVERVGFKVAKGDTISCGCVKRKPQ